MPRFFALALLLVGVPGFVGEYFMLPETDNIDPDVTLSVGYWWPLAVSLFGSLLGGVLLQGALTRSTVLHLSGRKPDMIGSLTITLRLLLPLVGLSIYVGFLIAAGFICLIVPGIMFWCALSVAVPAMVEEGGGVMASIDRSRELTRGSRLQIFLLGILFTIFTVVTYSVIGRITGVSMWGSTDGASPLLAGVATGIADIVTGSITSVVIAALYAELREVKEGSTTAELTTVFD